VERVDPGARGEPPGDGPGQRAGGGTGHTGSEDDHRGPPAAVDGGRGREAESDRDAGDEHSAPPVDHDRDSPGGEGDEVQKRLVHR
jgi:hypothetical protein